MAIIDFLKTQRSPDQLAVALEVIKEFKGCESKSEWLMVSFSAWAKLEQLEEFLRHLVHGEPLEEDTLAGLAEDNERTP